MPQIEVLDQQTIDKIAAGEVIERPASVVKELVENAIDALASAVTVEIKEGGISFIRITDNGCGIEKDQVPLAFLRHSTSKIRRVEDLMTVSSLGFRGEALSSIAAVSQVELITKTSSTVSGVRYVIEGGKEKLSEEIGAPEGTTFLVRNLFYNTPARRKFLKTPQTEAGYIADLLERMALSHPEVSFKFIVNNQVKLHTSGNSNLKEIIYHIYGRDIAANLIEIKTQNDLFSMEGFIGKPLISRGNRNFENYFVNGRYVRSSLIARGIEEGYKSFVMQHKYPFTVLHFSIRGELLDVNVHPTKMELRFGNQEQIYENIVRTIREAINQSELIYQVELSRRKEEKKGDDAALRHIPEPFEKKRLSALREAVRKDSPYERKYQERPQPGTGESARPERGDAWERAMKGAGAVPGPQPGTGENTRLQPALKGAAGQMPEQAVERPQPETEAAGQTVSYRQASISDLLVREEAAPYGSSRNQTAAASGTRAVSAAAGQPSVESVSAAAGQPSVGSAGNVAGQPSMESSGAAAGQPSVENAGNAAGDTALPDTPASSGNAAAPQALPQRHKLLSPESVPYHTIIGQVFDTYWLVQMEDSLYIIDQHAAHEKVLYERTMASLREREYTSQAIFPPILLSLSMQEEALLKRYMDYFTRIGFVIEPFGGKEYAVTSVPGNLFGLNEKELLLEMLDSLSGLKGSETPELVLEKIASMSCKAAVKGSQRLSREEIAHLIGELLTLENPYHCPHGRPTIISISKYELEKKFKRVL